jgi:hypothetical protein
MEWVMDRAYPAALYWLAGVVQRVSNRAGVSAEAIEGRLEREEASRAEHENLDTSPPTSVVVEQLHLENMIFLAKIRQDHGSDESLGTDEYIAQLVAKPICCCARVRNAHHPEQGCEPNLPHIGLFCPIDSHAG